ncbi:glycosyltransferase [Psychromicrobium sp. YIM B11713]|uniref:glycosyltransferase n=1 Tax=Psychromicrobium sp. YIM B11713 TaxID=3145233 RepID=UPI00374EE457
MSNLNNFFTVIDDGGSGLSNPEGVLSDRELALLRGSLNYYSFAYPRRDFRVVVLRGPDGTMPKLTDRSNHFLEWEPDRIAMCTVAIRSMVGEELPTRGSVLELVVDLGGKATDEGLLSTKRRGLVGQAAKRVRIKAPIAFDVVRQGLTDVYEAKITPRRRATPHDIVSPIASTRELEPSENMPPKAILFGLHWFEMGGAERWALDAIQAAVDLGFVPIVITDRDSTHPWICRPELDSALILPLTFPLNDNEESLMLANLLSAYTIVGAHVHHSRWLYHRLAWLRAVNPGIRIIDSLHVVEWRTGGFVEQSVKFSSVIDLHHVISPALRDYLIFERKIPRARVMLAPLHQLTASADNSVVSTRHEVFTVSFIGRLTQQKRPYLFLKFAQKLHRALRGNVRFIVHGDGILTKEVHNLVNKFGLQSCIDLRTPPFSVDETLKESDLLVISSDNEGLTLTTFEATAHGVAVISTDVGSQASLVSSNGLVDRLPLAFIKQATALAVRISHDEDFRRSLIIDQQDKIAKLKQLPEAKNWVAGIYRGWNSGR